MTIVVADTSPLNDLLLIGHVDVLEAYTAPSLCRGKCFPNDAAGRAHAVRLGIPNTGTLGVLRAAAIRRLLDLPAALERLARTTFRVAPDLLAELLTEDAERKRNTY